MRDIIMSVANEEMNYFVENGAEMVYEEGRISAFFKKIIDMIKSAWERIKSIFSRVLDALSGSKGISGNSKEDKQLPATQGGKQLPATQGGKQLPANTSTSLTTRNNDVVGEKAEKAAILKFASSVYIEDVYSPDGDPSEFCNNLSNAFRNLIKLITKAKGSFSSSDNKNGVSDDYVGKLRSATMGSSIGDVMSTSDFSSLLEKKLGLDKTVSKLRYDANTIINELYGHSTKADEVKKIYNATHKAFAEMENCIKYAEKEAMKRNDEKESSWYSFCASLSSGAISILSECQRRHITAVSKFRSNCKNLARKCIEMARNSDKIGVKEQIEYYNFESLLH